MLLTRDCDYAVRILRALSGGETTSVQDICRAEEISAPITYKLARKLEQSGYIKSYRGAGGGYALAVGLEELTLYDVCRAVDKDLLLIECMDMDYVCLRNPADAPCRVHKELCRLQAVMVRELQKKNLKEILSNG